MDKKQKLLRNNAFQTVLASLICIVIGLIVGFVVLLIISPSGAGKAIIAIMKNFFYYPNAAATTKYFGTTLIKASALLMCALSVIFAYKVGLFNIGAAGQYVIGAGGCLYMALRFNLPWYICLIAGVLSCCGGRNFRCIKSIFECKRSNLLHYAKLDFSLQRKYVIITGKGWFHTIYKTVIQLQQKCNASNSWIK